MHVPSSILYIQTQQFIANMYGEMAACFPQVYTRKYTYFEYVLVYIIKFVRDKQIT